MGEKDDSANLNAEGAPQGSGEPAPVKLAVQPRVMKAAPQAALEVEQESAEPEEEAVRLVVEKSAEARHPSGAVQMTKREQESKEAEDKEQWGEAREPAQRKWLLTAAAVSLLAVVAVVTGMIMLANYRTKKAAEEKGSQARYISEERDTYNAKDPQAYYRENPDEVKRDAIALLRAFSAATSWQEARKLVRATPGIDDRMAKSWSKWQSPPDLDGTPRTQASTQQVGDIGYMVLVGRCEDFEPFRAYFVRENDRMLLDWDATVGYCTVAIPELAKASGATFEVRGLLERQEMYSIQYPESKYVSYMISTPDRESFVWGYAERGTPMEQKIHEVLDQGRFLLQEKPSDRIFVRLHRLPAEGGLPNQFLMEELYHREWLTPNK